MIALLQEGGWADLNYAMSPYSVLVFAIATRYDKRAANFLAGVYAAAILILLNEDRL